jgi:hypothetical protein
VVITPHPDITATVTIAILHKAIAVVVAWCRIPDVT